MPTICLWKSDFDKNKEKPRGQTSDQMFFIVVTLAAKNAVGRSSLKNSQKSIEKIFDRFQKAAAGFNQDESQKLRHFCSNTKFLVSRFIQRLFSWNELFNDRNQNFWKSVSVSKRSTLAQSQKEKKKILKTRNERNESQNFFNAKRYFWASSSRDFVAVQATTRHFLFLFWVRQKFINSFFGAIPFEARGLQMERDEKIWVQKWLALILQNKRVVFLDKNGV